MPELKFNTWDLGPPKFIKDKQIVIPSKIIGYDLEKNLVDKMTEEFTKEIDKEIMNKLLYGVWENE